MCIKYQHMRLNDYDFLDTNTLFNWSKDRFFNPGFQTATQIQRQTDRQTTKTDIQETDTQTSRQTASIDRQTDRSYDVLVTNWATLSYWYRWRANKTLSYTLFSFWPKGFLLLSFQLTYFKYSVFDFKTRWRTVKLTVIRKIDNKTEQVRTCTHKYCKSDIYVWLKSLIMT